MQICYICLKIPWNFTPLEVNQFILDDSIILWNDPWTQLPNTCIYTFVVKSKCTSIFLIFSESKADRTCSSYRISLTYSTFSKRKRINKASKWIRLGTNKGFTLSKDAWQSQKKTSVSKIAWQWISKTQEHYMLSRSLQIEVQMFKFVPDLFLICLKICRLELTDTLNKIRT